MRETFLELVDEGYLDIKSALVMCVAWLSPDDVANMMRANDILIEEEEDEVSID
jgi:hypothetical protein